MVVLCLLKAFVLLTTIPILTFKQLPLVSAGAIHVSTPQAVFSGSDELRATISNALPKKNGSAEGLPSTLGALLEAIEVMQHEYFQLDAGTWPDAIDWTAAVLGTHVSATLSTLVASVDSSASPSCSDLLSWSNYIDRYFAHTSAFYFGENALSLRGQAYDDMLWVVLGWLENIKLMDLFTSVRSGVHHEGSSRPGGGSWQGSQFKPVAAHRARIFYEIAAHGWDNSLCHGGMLWNPHLKPYKNSITNELFISASISMHLYFPGDDNDSPFVARSDGNPYPRDQQHLDNAVEAYAWLKASNMMSPETPGLYADGYHISGWHREPDGRVDPGTGDCDELNPMVYTYNQGVVLTGLRGLWLATSTESYLKDGHDLIRSVIDATGWPDRVDKNWSGLGRGGVLEEYCDSRGGCSQNGHTFKGIFFNHLAEFCRSLSPIEEEYLSSHTKRSDTRQTSAEEENKNKKVWHEHLRQCKSYRPWLQHNAHAAAVTRDDDGKFGTWWGREYPFDDGRDNDGDDEILTAYQVPKLPHGATDYANLNSSQLLPPGLHETNNDKRDVNDRGRGRTVETQSGGLAVLRALWQWEITQFG